MKFTILLMIFIIFLGCTSSPKDIKNETIENKSFEYVKNETGDSMADAKEEAPEEVWIKEYESANIFDTWNVTVKGIFMHSGKIKAELDISAGFDDLLKDTPSMPLYLGHRLGEEVIVGHGNDYYLKEIKKFGKDVPGYVVISKEKPTEIESEKCEEQIFLENTAGALDSGLSLGEIKEENGKKSAEVFYSEIEGNDFHFFACKGDAIWVGECAYSIDEIMNETVLLKLLEVTNMAERENKEPEGKKTTVKGVARRIKAGLEVDNVWLIDLPINQEEKYAEKLIEVTGYVVEAPELVVNIERDKEGKPIGPISQGVEGESPLVMRDILSIKILKK